MTFLPKELNQIALTSMKNTIDMTNNFRKHLKKAGAVEKISQKTLNVLNVRFTPDYTVDIKSDDAKAIEIPISNTVGEVTPVNFKVRTPITNAREFTPDIVSVLAGILQNAVLKAEDSYIMQNIVAKTTNVIDGTADPVAAAEEAFYDANDVVDGYDNALLVVHNDDRKKFSGHTPEYNSIRRYLDDFGINVMISNNITKGEAYFVPMTKEAVILGQIDAQNPEKLVDSLNMAIALGMEETIAFVVKTPEALSKITLE